MNLDQASPDSSFAIQADTACGARVMLTPHTPFIHFRDEVIYFCSEGCKQLYVEDPLASCMADRLLSGK